MRNHDPFIDRLSQSAQPVRRVWPTPWRVTGWIAAALPCGALSSWAFHTRLTDWSQPDATIALITLLLSLIIAGSSLAAAFTLSIAGRKVSGMGWLLLLAGVWLTLNLLNMSSSRPPAGAGRFGEGIHCYLFMLSASLPMMLLSVIALQRTRSLHPGKSLALAGCGSAFSASMLLSLCHDTHLHMIDFLMHLAAGITIVAITVLVGRRWVRLAQA
ncbi:NrsF family protein [Pantoea sp.]|uniref:NrsF family protein n=1 Tax=Pantoea sp. TaxID=69393 RepID=UPI0029094E49|nr:NrsF family protein [Pantoea sp.]MDU4128308.1 NrsF family protein [Pantoea sp.]